MTGRDTPRWTPQSTTPIDEPPPWARPRMARGSMPPPPQVDDADATAPRVRLVALFEHEPAVPVALDAPVPEAPRLRPRPARGAPLGLCLGVIAVLVWLGYLMVTR